MPRSGFGSSSGPQQLPPSDPVALREAAEWFARLNDDQRDQNTELSWRNWLQAKESNQIAWAKVEQIDCQLKGLDSLPAQQALNTPVRDRRHVLKLLATLSIGLPLISALGWRASLPWRADYATTLGEIRNLTLADGSQLWLNTNSAVDITFDAQSRSIQLLQGEIAIRTAQDTRPLQVISQAGTIEPLGTWFNVRQHSDFDEVQVYEGRVRVTIRQSLQALEVPASERVQFTAQQLSQPQPLNHTRPNWTQGILVTDGMSLKDVITELGRYRRGYLGINDDVAQLRLVGAFPLQDTDPVLDAIAESLPVQVVRYGPWWAEIRKK